MPAAVDRWGVSIATPWRLRGLELLASRLDGEGLLREMLVPHDATRVARFARRTLGTDARLTRTLSQREFDVPATSIMPWDAFQLGLYYRVPGPLRRLFQPARRDFGRRFDRAAAKRLVRFPPAAAVLLPSAKNAAIRAARRAGAAPVLFLSTHPWSYDELVTDAPETYRTFFEGWTREAIQSHEAAIRLAQVVLVESPNVANGVESAMGIPAPTIGVTEQGVDTSRFAFRERPGGERPLHVVSPGQPTLFKGHATCIQAVRLAGDAVASCRIYGLGQPGAGMEPTLALIDETPKVERPREVHPAEMLRAYHEADVCVLTTVCDSMPRAILEAMATGLPVITTPNSGYAHLIRTGENGFIVPTRDPAAVTEILVRLSHDPDLRARVGRAARATAEQCTWDAWADRFIAEVGRLAPDLLETFSRTQRL